MKKLGLTIVFSIASVTLFASHIIGGYMQYRHLGQHVYEITLTIYRDCYYGGPAFDDPAYVGVFTANRSLYRNLSIANPVITQLDPTPQDPCAVVPPTICVEEGVYKDTLYLPPRFNGYDLVYQRCCRNGTILNVQQPNQTGATYTAHIPGPNELSQPNSSPVFNQFPPITICTGDWLSVDQSALDFDGDSISYSLCQPYNGAQQGTAQPNPPLPPPFNGVTYSNGYTAASPLTGNPGLSIHPNTGLLSGRPTLQGQFVVGICVTEYRKGQIIGTYMRDFQFNVIHCQKMAAIAPIPDTFYCAPYTIQFTNQSINATQYRWDFGDPSTTQDYSTATNPSYTYPDTGTYSVRLIARNNRGCIDTAYTTVTIREGATAAFVFSPPCLHDDLVFTDLSTATKGTINSWHWTFGDGATDTVQYPRHTYAQAGNYTVGLTVTTDAGCIATVNRQVTFKPAPSVAIAGTNACAGDTLQLINNSTSPASPLVQQRWTVNGLSMGNQLPIPLVFGQSGQYPIQLWVANQAGCTDSIQQMLTIHAPPIVAINGDSIICAGNQTTLSAAGAATYTWQPNGVQQSTVVVSPQQSQTFTITGTDSLGCRGQTLFTVQVAPPLALSTVSNGPVCPGDTLQATAHTSGQVTWLSQGQLMGQGLQLHQQIWQNTTIVARALSPLGCMATDTLHVMTYPTPQPNVTPGNTTVCAGNALAFIASGGQTYSWAPSVDLSCTQCPNPLVTPTANRLYTVTVTNQYQCSDTATVAVRFFPRPSLTLQYDSIVCTGDTANLSLTGIQSIQWSPANAFACDTCIHTSVLLPNTSTIKAQYTDPNGCPGDTLFPITVLPVPTIRLQPDNPYVCRGNSIQLQVTGAPNLTWNPSPSLSCIQCPDPIATPNITTTYQVTGRYTSGCASDTSVTVVVRPLPEPDLMNDTSICLGDSLQLLSRAGQSWDWSTNHQALRCMACKAPWVKPSIPIQVHVQATDSWGCVGRDSVFIGLLPAPNLQVSAPDSLCPGDTAIVQYNDQLTGLAILPASGVSLLEPGKLQVIPTATTRYTLRGRGANSCLATERFTLNHAPLPDVDAGPDQQAYPYQPMQLQGYTDVPTYQWHPADSLQNAHLLMPTVQTAMRQRFTLWAQSPFGCTATDEVWVDITPLPVVNVPNAFSPNQDGHNDYFTVDLPGDYTLHTFQVFDRWGQLLYNSNQQINWSGKYEQQTLPAGVYMYRIVYGTPYGFPREQQGNITLLR